MQYTALEPNMRQSDRWDLQLDGKNVPRCSGLFNLLGRRGVGEVECHQQLELLVLQRRHDAFSVLQRLSQHTLSP